MKINWTEKVGDKTYLELLEQGLKSKPYDPVQVVFPFKLVLDEKYNQYLGVVKFFELSIATLLIAEGEEQSKNQLVDFQNLLKIIKESLEFLNRSIKKGEIKSEV